MTRYAADLDTTMRQVVALLPDAAPGFGVMARYPLGWVDANDQAYPRSTGKRIRPLFLLLCCEAAGGDWQKALPAAAAVELLHNFSLVHDDIQDDSELRHGRPTVWKIWGMPNAINAGDTLFTLAYTALENLSQTGIAPEVLVRIWRIFNATNIELTRGQHLDMRFEKQANVRVDEYVSMISGKSAALLGACAQMGSLIATGDEALAHVYRDFALNLGIAFQIRDDVLGIWGNPDVTGKSAATDIVSRKKSLPVLYGLANSEALVNLYAQTELPEREFVTRAVEMLDGLDARGYTEGMEAHYYQLALDSLEEANPQGEAADWLRRFVDVLFQRAY